jgi:hypothetical protein
VKPAARWALVLVLLLIAAALRSAADATSGAGHFVLLCLESMADMLAGALILSAGGGR